MFLPPATICRGFYCENISGKPLVWFRECFYICVSTKQKLCKMSDLQVNDRVAYSDNRSNRTGIIIETNFDEPGVAAGQWPKRARIKWDDNRPRTWIKASALVKLKPLRTEETPLSEAELVAYQVLVLTLKKTGIYGITIRDLDPTPANIKKFLGEILEQFEKRPREALEAVGFFDLPKFLNARNGAEKMG